MQEKKDGFFGIFLKKVLAKMRFAEYNGKEQVRRPFTIILCCGIPAVSAGVKGDVMDTVPDSRSCYANKLNYAAVWYRF